MSGLALPVTKEFTVVHQVHQTSRGSWDNRRRLTVAIALGLATVALAPAAEAPTVISQFKGKLVALSGNITVPAKDTAVGDPKYFALYFGAGWCGPCHKFTP